MTLHEALKAAANNIEQREARLLLSHTTGLSLSKIIINSHQPLDEPAKGAFFAAVDRRIAKEPLQYIMGEWEFMGLTMKADPRALIPRQETELLVEEALAHIRKLSPPAKILDMCTGSGCIAVSIAKLADATVTAVDISHKSLSLATENAVLHGLMDKIHFHQGDLFSGLENQTFDIIISNPPYIPAAEIAILQPEIHHEPKTALDGGNDGMDIYRRLVPQSLGYLAPGGKLLLEIGPPEVETIMDEAGYEAIRRINDYAGLPRVLVGNYG